MWRSVFVFVVTILFSISLQAEEPRLEIGWVGPLSGATAKYGAKEAALLAVEDVNAAGGIRGKSLRLIMEDGRCDGVASANAINKLVNADRVRFVIGGHCSRETLAMAPTAEKNRVLLLAAISSAPSISNGGDYVFRATPLMIGESPFLAAYAKARGAKRMAVVSEETEYCLATTDRLIELFRQGGGEVAVKKTFQQGEADLRSVMTAIRAHAPDILYVSTQSPDSSVLVMREIRNQKLNTIILGNSAFGNSLHSPGADPVMFEGVVYAEPFFDRDNPKAKRFIDAYLARYGGEDLPYGIWTAEAYDVVKLLARTIEQCGEDPEEVKRCLYNVKAYEGASGRFGIDGKGDGIRDFALQEIRQGKHERIAVPDGSAGFK